MIVYFFILSEKPSPPEAPIEVTEVKRDNVTLSWKPSKDDGGSPITGYIVEKRETWKTSWSMACRCGPDEFTSCLETLKEKQEYFFRVSAENAIGRSEPLETAQGVTPTSAFGKSSHNFHHLCSFLIYYQLKQRTINCLLIEINEYSIANEYLIAY